MVSFSVVIPTRNRTALPQASHCQRACADTWRQARSSSSTMAPAQHEALKDTSPLLRVLDNRERGPVPARNLGVAQAQGDCNRLSRRRRLVDRPGLPLARVTGLRERCRALLRRRHHGFRGWPAAGLPFAFDADAKSLDAGQHHPDLCGDLPAQPARQRSDPSTRACPSTGTGTGICAWRAPGHSLVHIWHGRWWPSASMPATCRAMRWKRQRRENLDRFSAKHGLPPLILKNHLNLVTDLPPDRR